MDYKDAIRQFECYQESGWSKSEVPNSACLVLALDALNRCRQLETESAAMLERVQRLESIAEAAQEVLQKEPTIICPRCDGSAGVERCVCEPWELLRQTVVEFKRVEGGSHETI